MSIVLSNVYLVEKMNLSKFLHENKKEVENHLMDKRFLSNPYLEKNIIKAYKKGYTDDKDSCIFHLKRLYNFRVTIEEFDIGLDNHLIIVDKYNIVKNIDDSVIPIDIHTGCSEWKDDINVLINEHDITINKNKISAEDFFHTYMDYENNYVKTERVLVDVSATHHFSIIDNRIVDNMIWRLVEKFTKNL